jgi:hypothetical protein
MTSILAERAIEMRVAGEALIREADNLACQSWNERMWADGGPIDPSPTIDQAINGGYAWLEIQCARCRTPRSVDLCELPHVPSTFAHDLAGRLRCVKCRGWANDRRPRCTSSPNASGTITATMTELVSTRAWEARLNWFGVEPER